MMDQQIKMIQKQLQSLEEQVIEIMDIKESLEQLRTVKVDQELLVPVSTGIFMKVKAMDTSRLQVNVGYNINAEKSIDETRELMDSQLQEIEKHHNDMSNELKKFLEHAKNLENELMGLMQENV